MVSVIDVNESELRIAPLKNGKEVPSLLWINVLSFCSQNTDLLSPKHKSSLQGIQKFHTNKI